MGGHDLIHELPVGKLGPDVAKQREASTDLDSVPFPIAGQKAEGLEFLGLSFNKLTGQLAAAMVDHFLAATVRKDDLAG